MLKLRAHPCTTYDKINIPKISKLQQSSLYEDEIKSWADDKIGNYMKVDQECSDL